MSRKWSAVEPVMLLVWVDMRCRLFCSGKVERQVKEALEEYRVEFSRLTGVNFPARIKLERYEEAEAVLDR